MYETVSLDANHFMHGHISVLLVTLQCASHTTILFFHLLNCWGFSAENKYILCKTCELPLKRIILV